MISENDVSVLIPLFRGRAFLERSVRTALHTGAAEVIVSDDASNDGACDTLAAWGEPRLRIIKQRENIGLWPNHLALLRAASTPHVKFLQQDDYIAVGGLKSLMNQMTSQTAVVSALPVYEDLSSGHRREVFKLSTVRRWTSDEYMSRLRSHGNELGNPSFTLFRKSALPHDAAAWDTGVSADLVANVTAASRGEVVLVPAGPIVIGEHPRRDTHQQPLEFRFQQCVNTAHCLRIHPDRRVRAYARFFAITEGVGWLIALRGAMRRGMKPHRNWMGDIGRIICPALSWGLLLEMGVLYRAFSIKFGKRNGRELDCD